VVLKLYKYGKKVSIIILSTISIIINTSTTSKKIQFQVSRARASSKSVENKILKIKKSPFVD